jgi:hypothetical protein
MHKIFRATLFLIFAAGLAIAFKYSAAAAGSASLSIATTCGPSAGQISLSIHENSGGTAINVAQTDLTYPSSQFNFISAAVGTGWSEAQNDSSTPGTLLFAAFPTPGTTVTGDQVVARVVLQAKTSSGVASVNFANSAGVAQSSDNTLLPLTTFGRNYSMSLVQACATPSYLCINTSNLCGTGSGARVTAYQYTTGPTKLAYLQMNNTGSARTESHIWNFGYQSWFTHIATAMGSSDSSMGTIIPMRFPGNTTDGLVYISYSGSGGKVEAHRFSPNLSVFPGYYDVSTNLDAVIQSSGTFVAGDYLGRGYDQLAYVLYNGSAGTVEVHLFDPTLQKAVGYYDVATNLSGVSATSGTFTAGDFLGRGYDQLAYVLYNGSTGKTEVHLFDPSLKKAVGYYDVATNLSGVSAASGTFTAGDFLGRGYSQLAYVAYNGTSSGKVEVHTFSRDLRQAVGFQDIATNLPGFDPAQ